VRRRRGHGAVKETTAVTYSPVVHHTLPRNDAIDPHVPPAHYYYYYHHYYMKKWFLDLPPRHYGGGSRL